MDARSVSNKYLGALNDDLEVMETPDGFIVWTPFHQSDGDGVILSVRRAPGGWLVSDDGSTLSGLANVGTAIDSPIFTSAWDALARPAGPFVPDDRGTDDGQILAWATDENLGQALNAVAMAAVRAEGLNHIRERSTGQRFPTQVSGRISFLLSDSGLSSRGVTCGHTVSLRSGRSKHVTASVETGGVTLAAFQAVNGKDSGSRERSFEHAYTLLSQAQIDHDSRFAVVDDIRDWDRSIIGELEEASIVLDYRDRFDEEVSRIVGRLPVPA